MEGRTMQERVTSVEDAPDIIVQHVANMMSVGIGLEPQTVVPGLHFIDAIYGSNQTQTTIGKLFAQKAVALGYNECPDFQDSDAEAEWHNEVGRAILDAVTGSSVEDALWTWLDRPATNRLIRILRKARDASFGRDE